MHIYILFSLRFLLCSDLFHSAPTCPTSQVYYSDHAAPLSVFANYGESMVIECDTGFTGRGRDNITCVDGVGMWDPSLENICQGRIFFCSVY